MSIPSFIPKQTNSGHATFSSCACFPCSLVFFSFFLSSRFLLLRLSKLCSESLAPQIKKKKEFPKSSAVSSRRDQEEVAVAFRSPARQKLISPSAQFFPTLRKPSPQYRLTGRRDESRVETLTINLQPTSKCHI